MVSRFEDITGDVESGEGGILASWFSADVQGPVAFSVGYLDRKDRQDIFYAWHHWSGHKAIRIGDCGLGHDPKHYLWGDYLLCDMVRFANAGLRPDLFDYRFFQTIPAVLVTNGNTAVLGGFIDLVTSVTAGRDWSREMFLVSRYGPDLVRKAHWLIRDRLEYMRGYENADLDLIARVESNFTGQQGFDEWARPDLPLTLTHPAVVQKWAGLVSAPEYAELALMDIAAMWVDAPLYVSREEWEQRTTKNGAVSFDNLARFFERFGHSLWPHGLTEAQILSSSGVEGRPL